MRYIMIADTTDSLQFLTFSVQEEEYAVDLLSVKEIKGWVTITPLPNAPDYVRGVLDLRGTVVPVFDMRSLFGAGHVQIASQSAIIILSCERGLYGLLVDSVTDILTAQPDEIQPTPHINQAGISFIHGIISHADRLIVLLALDHLFDHAAHPFSSSEQEQVGSL